MSLGLLLVVIAIAIVSCESALVRVSVNDKSSYSIHKEAFSASQPFLIEADLKSNVSGWEYLTIKNFYESNAKSTVNIFSYYEAAGIAEGYMLSLGIYQSYSNLYADYWGADKPPKEVVNFMIENYKYVNEMANTNYETDAYWYSVKCTLSQLRGILTGASAARAGSTEEIIVPASDVLLDVVNVDPSTEMSMVKLLLMNAWGDLYTITTKFQIPTIQQKKTLLSAKAQELGLRNKRITYPRQEIERDLRCSSLFKLLPDYSDVLFGHATWSSYIALGPRTFKSINLPTKIGSDSAFEQRFVHFSSSPGLLASLDDFYIVSSPSSRLAVIETTNDVLNISLFAKVVPQSSLCWLRAATANNVAVSGQSWTSAFSRYASGTYTNQWQVFDMNVFKAGSPPPKDTFWLLEEVPGLVVSRDISDVFASLGYWASYNVPYFEEISVISGNAAACRLLTPINNTDYCWETAPRALIFKDREASVANMQDLRFLINYNDWEHDPLSMSDPCKSIACRRDLESDPELFYPSGATDAKLSSFTRSMRGDFQSTPDVDMRLGPTHDNQPVFCWSQLKETYVHEGQPDCFGFDWVTIP